VEQIGATAIIAPSGEIVARSSTNGEELVIHRCDLDLVKPYKESLFHFGRQPAIEHYQAIATRPPRRRRRRGREAANGGAAVLWHGRPPVGQRASRPLTERSLSGGRQLRQARRLPAPRAGRPCHDAVPRSYSLRAPAAALFTSRQ